MNSINLLLGCFSDHIPFAWHPIKKKQNKKPSTGKALPIWQKSQLLHQKITQYSYLPILGPLRAQSPIIDGFLFNQINVSSLIN